MQKTTAYLVYGGLVALLLTIVVVLYLTAAVPQFTDALVPMVAGVKRMADKLDPDVNARATDCYNAVVQAEATVEPEVPIPPALLMAMCWHESRMKLSAYNSKECFNKAGQSIGHARGPWQIMDGYQADYGVNASTVAQWGPSTLGSYRARLKMWNWLRANAPDATTDLRTATAFVYLAHYAGNSGAEGRVSSAIARDGAATVDNVDMAGSRAGILEAADDAVNRWQPFVDAQTAGNAAGDAAPAEEANA